MSEHQSYKVQKKKKRKITFNIASYEEVLNKIRKLQTAKTIRQKDIPTKILKENSEVFARYFHKNINFCIENSIFPSELKVADVTPGFKKKFSISILPNISKIYERCLHNHSHTYFDEII